MYSVFAYSTRIMRLLRRKTMNNAAVFMRAVSCGVPGGRFRRFFKTVQCTAFYWPRTAYREAYVLSRRVLLKHCFYGRRLRLIDKHCSRPLRFFYVIAAYLYADLYNRTIKLRFSFFKSIARYLNIVRGGYLPARMLSQVRSLISGTGWGDSSKR